MKRYILILIIFFSIYHLVLAQVEFRTIYTTQVGPGVVHKKVIAPAVPWELDILEIELANPYLAMESVKANDQLKGRERTSSMAARNNYDGHRIIGGTNADFFDNDGVPINAHVVNGQLLKTENIDPAAPTYWSTIAFDASNHPAITTNIFSSLVVVNHQSRAIDNVNSVRQANQLILYNSFFGASTETNIWGTEVLISPIDEWIVNDTVRCIAEKIELSTGNMQIPEGKAVLSGHESAATFLENKVQEGDTLKLFIGLLPAITRLKNLAGGFPRIVKDGINYAVDGYREEGGASTFHTDRHPRTAVGFSADSTIFYFITVDGRQEHSLGMNLIELADFMVNLGIAQGLNLDGGGSTTMLVRDEIKNSPSDGSERAVANALFAISSAPTGELSHIQIEPDHYVLRMNDEIQFRTTGWDQYYNPVAIDKNLVQYGIDSTLGTITENGLFLATTNGGSGYIFTKFDNLVDSAYVYIKAIDHIALSPQNCVTDTIQEIQFEVSAVDENGAIQSIEKNNYLWHSTNETVGTIDENGIFIGKKEGFTKIIVQFANLADTANVYVQIATNTTLLDPMDTLMNWKLSGENIDTTTTSLAIVETPRTCGTKSFKIDYQFTRLATDPAWVYLHTDIPVYGVPDTIQLDFKSDGNDHKVYILASDDNNELYRAAMVGYAQDTAFVPVNIKTISFRPVDTGNFFYPIRIKEIQIKLGTSSGIGEISRGTIYLDNLRLQYPRFTDIISPENQTLPTNFRLYQNYPNPFNPSTAIPYELPQATYIELAIFNTLGQHIKTLVDAYQFAGNYSVNFNACELPSGIYFYRLQAGKTFLTQKMILMK